jgi:hypothetical protein
VIKKIQKLFLNGKQLETDLTRVGTKVFVFVFFAKVFAKTHFSFSRNICDENTKLSRKFSQKLFRENSEMKRHYSIYELKFFFWLFTSKKPVYYFFLWQNNFKKYSILKGKCQEIFDLGFFIKQYPLGPWFTG